MNAAPHHQAPSAVSGVVLRAPNTYFNYHQDDQGEVTVVVNLSPGRSTLHIAGASEDLAFTMPGNAFMFPSKVFHRSGAKQRRTLTVSFFFNIVELTPGTCRA